VQSENCAPIAKAFKEHSENIPKIEKKETVAEGIAIAEPIRGRQILEVVRKTSGHFITVTEHEIIESLRRMCKMGFYIEPTSASTTAGIKKYVQESQSNELIVSVFTGHGLKTTDKMLKMV
jgi:threonine synthase